MPKRPSVPLLLTDSVTAVVVEENALIDAKFRMHGVPCAFVNAKCMVCGVQCRYNAELAAHFKSPEHRAMMEPFNPFVRECAPCSVKFAKPIRMQEHCVSRNHLAHVLEKRCFGCGETQRTYPVYADHVKKCFPDIKNADLLCFLCDEMTTCPSAFLNHTCAHPIAALIREECIPSVRPSYLAPPPSASFSSSVEDEEEEGMPYIHRNYRIYLNKTFLFCVAIFSLVDFDVRPTLETRHDRTFFDTASFAALDRTMSPKDVSDATTLHAIAACLSKKHYIFFKSPNRRSGILYSSKPCSRGIIGYYGSDLKNCVSAVLQEVSMGNASFSIDFIPFSLHELISFHLSTTGQRMVLRITDPRLHKNVNRRLALYLQAIVSPLPAPDFRPLRSSIGH